MGQPWKTYLIVAAIVCLLVGVGVGWMAKPIPPPGPEWVAKTELDKAVADLSKVRADLDKALKDIEELKKPPVPEYTFYYVSHGGPGDPWWGPVIKGTQDASKLLNVETHYLGPKVFSIEELTSMMESAIAARPDGIVLTITSVEPLDPLVKEAKAKGIPVLAVNVDDPRPLPQRMPYLGYIGQKEYEAGAGMARRVLMEFTPTHAVVGIHEVGHIGLEARALGVSDVLGEKGVPVEKLDITTDPAKGIEILRSYLAGHPETDMIFLLGPIGAHPAIDLVKELGKVGEIRLATVDLDEKILAAIKDGTMICAVSQQPYMQGFLPVVWLYLHNKYGFIPPEHLATGPGIIDSATVGFIEKQITTTGGA